MNRRRGACVGFVVMSMQSRISILLKLLADADTPMSLTMPNCASAVKPRKRYTYVSLNCV